LTVEMKCRQGKSEWSDLQGTAADFFAAVAQLRKADSTLDECIEAVADMKSQGLQAWLADADDAAEEVPSD
jgi:prefoldin subunit 5